MKLQLLTSDAKGHILAQVNVQPGESVISAFKDLKRRCKDWGRMAILNAKGVDIDLTDPVFKEVRISIRQSSGCEIWVSQCLDFRIAGCQGIDVELWGDTLPDMHVINSSGIGLKDGVGRIYYLSGDDFNAQIAYKSLCLDAFEVVRGSTGSWSVVGEVDGRGYISPVKKGEIIPMSSITSDHTGLRMI